MLAVVRGQARRAEPLDERGVQPAWPDRTELCVVSDEHDLALCPRRVLEHAVEGAGVGHGRLVHDDDGTAREA